MKYCSHCGKELEDDAIICVNCGCKAPSSEEKKEKVSNGLRVAAKILMIISTVACGFFIIPLAWCIPMTISCSNKIKNNEPISLGFKICTLLFVNTIAGILLLIDDFKN